MRSIRTGTATSPRGIAARAVALTTAVMLLTLALGVGVVSADGGRDHRDAENTFTKWRTAEAPVAPVLVNMAGVVGGDVGAGTFTGEVLSYAPGPPTVIDALYHFHGGTHSFTAAVHVVQTGSTAEITGRVIDGWLKGNLVEAGYTVITCDHDGISTTCFSGWLDILRGTKSAN